MDGTQRRLCQWMTPQWAAALLVERYYGDLTAADLVLEPSCGRGAWLNAIPPFVPAIGVEIDETLAREAERNTGRRIYVGDFRTLSLTELPTVVLGNPPFDLSLLEDFLKRAAQLLPEHGRCGFLLPAYAMQTYGRVMRLHATWSMEACVTRNCSWIVPAPRPGRMALPPSESSTVRVMVLP